MAIKFPDISEHNNPNNASVDSNFVRGGRRDPVADLTALYALASKVDQLKEQATRVYVISEDKDYKLVDIADITSGVFNPTAWLLDTIDESDLVHKTGSEDITGIKTVLAAPDTSALFIKETGNLTKRTEFQGGGINLFGGTVFPTYSLNIAPTQITITNSGSGSTTNIIPNGVTSPYINIKTEGGSFAGTLQTPTLTDNRTYTLPNSSGNIALMGSLSASAPLTYSSSTGVFSMSQASAVNPGWVSASDFNKFNSYNLQGIYNNSSNINPHITTAVANGSFTLKRGTSADTDDVVRVQNGTGTNTFTIKGNGDIDVKGDIISTGGNYINVWSSDNLQSTHIHGTNTTVSDSNNNWITLHPSDIEFYLTGNYKGKLVSGSTTTGAGVTWTLPNATGIVATTLTATSTLDFPSTNASTHSDLTITVTGAALGDAVILGIPHGSVLPNSCYTAWVSAADTVTVRFSNYDSAVSSNPSSGSFRVSVLKY